MTKELAVYLLGSKDVYLTSEGKKALERLVTTNKKVVTSNGKK